MWVQLFTIQASAPCPPLSSQTHTRYWLSKVIGNCSYSKPPTATTPFPLLPLIIRSSVIPPLPPVIYSHYMSSSLSSALSSSFSFSFYSISPSLFPSPSPSWHHGVRGPGVLVAPSQWPPDGGGGQAPRDQPYRGWLCSFSPCHLESQSQPLLLKVAPNATGHSGADL